MNWLRFKQCLVTLGDLGLVSPLPIIADKPLDLTVPGGAVLLPPLADDAGFGLDGGTISVTGAPTHGPHASQQARPPTWEAGMAQVDVQTERGALDADRRHSWVSSCVQRRKEWLRAIVLVIEPLQNQ